jgi:hypothetical protein
VKQGPKTRQKIVETLDEKEKRIRELYQNTLRELNYFNLILTIL